MNKDKRVSLRKGPRPPPSIFNDDSLLFQFTLQEFLTSSLLIHNSSSISLFKILVGDLGQFLSPSSIGGAGSLLKLYYYLTLLQRHFPTDFSLNDSLFSGIFHCVEKAIYDALQSQRDIELTGKMNAKGLSHLQAAFKQLAKYMQEKLVTFRKDENFFYFILRRKEQFEKIYGKNFVFNTLDKAFDGGIKECEEWMIERYRQRHFLHVLPSIRNYMHSLHVE